MATFRLHQLGRWCVWCVGRELFRLPSENEPDRHECVLPLQVEGKRKIRLPTDLRWWNLAPVTEGWQRWR